MGFVSYGMLVSIDGFVAAADGDISGFPAPGPALHRVFNEGQRAAALSVYGSRMWRMMAYWGRPDPEWDEVAEDFAQAWVATPKVVFSATVTEVPEGVTLIGDEYYYAENPPGAGVHNLDGPSHGTPAEEKAKDAVKNELF